MNSRLSYQVGLLTAAFSLLVFSTPLAAFADPKSKGSLKLSKPTEAIGTGALSSDRIQRTVRRRQGALKSCYESELKKNPSLSGTIKVRWTIKPSGRVSSAHVTQNTMGSDLVGHCIATQIKRWRFDKPQGGDVTVAYPFHFKPSK